MVCSAPTVMEVVVCSAPKTREEVVCPDPMVVEKESVNNKEENLIPEGWEQQIGDEDLPHLEGRDYEGQFTTEEWERKIREHQS